MLAPLSPDLTKPERDEFDPARGSALERLIFGNRLIVLALCAFVTLALGSEAIKLRLAASFENQIPRHQAYIVNYLANQDDLHGLGNAVQIVVQANQGSILQNSYIQALQKINDEVFLLPGVDRSYMESLWRPNVRWYAVTAEGQDSGPVMPQNFAGSASDIATLALNIQRSGQIGRLVAPDFKSSMLRVPLLSTDTATGQPLDYGALARQLDAIRAQFENQGVSIRITGFAMIVGDLIEGLHKILFFFLAAAVIAAAMVYWYTRCVRSTGLVVLCSSLAVCWQLGLLTALGFALDPYSILVPFLIFAIGMSHGSQKMNGVMQDIGRGNPKLVAARLTFRRLFLAGFTALICDAVGFAVLMTIQIEAIRELALVASIGVALLIITNLIMLPVLLSFTGVSTKAAARSLREEDKDAGAARHPVWRALDIFTQRRYAAIAIIGATLIGIAGAVIGAKVQVGDIDPGAPELRANSIYNQDNAYIGAHYAASSDVFVVMVKTPLGACGDYHTLEAMGMLQAELDDLPGVISSFSFVDFEKQASVEMNEGNFAWYGLMPNQAALNETIGGAPNTLVNQVCSFLPLSVFLRDHKAQTLTDVARTVQSFAAIHNGNGVSFLMAAGNGGIAAATNQVVENANRLMLIEVYTAVILLSLITFRSWRAVLTAVLPLALTSVLAQALMVQLGIGIKVATLPVTALGVGIGVDYALYILSVTLANLRQGMDLSEAYYRALIFTGKVVMLTGFTLAAAVGTWAFSPIKFQADMGTLLAFMFLWNMLGALILLPALASFLLPRNMAKNGHRKAKGKELAGQVDGRAVVRDGGKSAL